METSPDTNLPPEDGDPKPGPLKSRAGIPTLVLLGIVGLGLLASMLFSDNSESDGIGAIVGSEAPNFAVRLFDGSDFDLRRHLAEDGRPVVLNLWASWCIPCRTEMPDLEILSTQFPDALVIGIAVDDTESAARSFAHELRVTYPLAYDTDDVIAGDFGSVYLPMTYFIDRNGTIFSRLLGIQPYSELARLTEEMLAR